MPENEIKEELGVIEGVSDFQSKTYSIESLNPFKRNKKLKQHQIT